ncbi:MAG: HAD family hydrolase [Polymorphobacter sp.]
MKISNSQAFTTRPTAVLLDLDNTLYDYAPCNAAGMAAAATLAASLYGLSAADFGQCFADARVEIKARLGATAAAHSRLLYFQRTIERAGFASQPFAVLQIEQAFWRAYLDTAVLFPHVLDFLDDLRIAAVPAVIVTDLTAQIQLRKLILLGIDRMVDWLVTSEECGADKPSPLCFELALAKLGGVEGPVWCIGDSIDADMVGAKNAVGAVTLLRSGDAAARSHPAVDATFSAFADVRQLFARLAP